MKEREGDVVGKALGKVSYYLEQYIRPLHRRVVGWVQSEVRLILISKR